MPSVSRDPVLSSTVSAVRELVETLKARIDALAVERQRYLEYFQHGPQACLITDARGRIREANQAAAELLGTSPERLYDKPLALFRRRKGLAFVARGGSAPRGDLFWLVRRQD